MNVDLELITVMGMLPVLTWVVPSPVLTILDFLDVHQTKISINKVTDYF